ncbi:MAG: ATP synthase F1 subunit delta [Acidobacteria bacterium]|nr:ATP synthase F1 subunit delta [Acidobacteriota bacterium]
MTQRAAATRYARALLEVSLQDGDPDRVERDLGEFAKLLDEHPTLGRALLNPAVSPARKRAVVAEIVERDGALSPIVVRLLTMLAERDRLALMPDLLEVYRERLNDHRGIMRARITTAAPLDDGRASAFEKALGQATGRQVRIERSVDPALVGGLVAQVGGIVYDGSVMRHLDRLRQEFGSRV